MPPAVVFIYKPDRKAAHPAKHLKTFRGILQVDGYAGFEALAADGKITLAACWSHARRKFYDLHEAGSPIATEALACIAAIYKVEANIRGQPPDLRRQARQEQSRPLVNTFRAWLDVQLARLPGRNRLAEAVCYALGRWTALARFLDDGRIDWTPIRSSKPFYR